MEPLKNHWEGVYRAKVPNQVSWYQSHLKSSFDLITKTLPNKGCRIIDVGGGASTLVDDLLHEGYQNISVLDISKSALGESQKRLGKLSEKVEWIEGDITDAALLESSFDLWHDRAVFHFLTKTEDRQKYVTLLHHALKKEGHVIIAAFDIDGGPLRCSGLDVMRHGAATLQAELGQAFALRESIKEQHHTPSQTTQNFLYCHFQENEGR
jgi:ubiquinone/menaquinone biosynthesis C-methylase UbiE